MINDDMMQQLGSAISIAQDKRRGEQAFAELVGRGDGSSQGSNAWNQGYGQDYGGNYGRGKGGWYGGGKGGGGAGKGSYGYYDADTVEFYEILHTPLTRLM